VPLGDDACSVTTDVLSEGGFVNGRFIWTRELQPNSRRNPSFHSLLFGLSQCYSNLLSLEKKQEEKHSGNYRAEKCHDGHQPDHLLARTQTDDSAEATGDFPSLVDILEREPEVGRGHCRIS
jgi:hypothetical protein